jgi:hypothetical protein
MPLVKAVGEPSQSLLATMQNPLRRQPHVGDAEVDVAGDQGDAPFCQRPGRPPCGPLTVRPATDYVDGRLPEVHDHLDAAQLTSWPSTSSSGPYPRGGLVTPITAVPTGDRIVLYDVAPIAITRLFD